jgi:hypothetical protein
MPLPVRLELSALTAYINLSQVRLDVQFTSTAGEVEGEYSHSVAAVWLESQTKIKGPTYFFTFPSVKGKPYLWEAGTYRFTFMVVSCYVPFRSVLGLHPFLISVAADRLVRTIIVAPLLFFLGRILFPSVRLPSFMVFLFCFCVVLVPRNSCFSSLSFILALPLSVLPLSSFHI